MKETCDVLLHSLLFWLTVVLVEFLLREVCQGQLEFTERANLAEFIQNTAQDCLILESGGLTNRMEQICNFKFRASAEENV